MASESNSHDDDGAAEAPPLLSSTRRSFLKGLAAGAAGAGIGSIAEQRLSRQDGPDRPVLTATQAQAHADAAVAMLGSLLPELVEALNAPLPVQMADAISAVRRKQQAITNSLRQLDPMVSARVSARCDRIAREDDSGIRRLLEAQSPANPAAGETHSTAIVDAVRSYFADSAESLAQQSSLASSPSR